MYIFQYVMTLVLDLASRFADGRLSSQKLNEADDEELARLLIEVRGIGRVRIIGFVCYLEVSVFDCSVRPSSVDW
jgi:hypothetical protein